MSDTVCIRLPGRGTTVRLTAREQFFSHEYREFGIDAKIFGDILKAIDGLAAERKVIVVPSGAGAFLLGDLALRLGLSSRSVGDANRTVIDAQSVIVFNWFLENSPHPCVMISDYRDVSYALAENRICIARPTEIFESTDTLWAALAYQSRSRYALSFKRLSRTRHILPDIRDHEGEIPRDWMLRNAKMWESVGGAPVLDVHCLQFLWKAECSTWLLQPEFPGDMARVIAGSSPRGVSKIIK
ncbi:hypothetical protein [Streptomyces sp. NPDC088196]|uniref:hypothetical protein n=1 Tax=Streptomyces sp. NPDC088196 TaxID=3154868 RepID=UPI00344FCC61